MLRLVGNVNEAITTLLLNYVAADVLAFLIYGPWKDAAGHGQPASKPLPTTTSCRLRRARRARRHPHRARRGGRRRRSRSSARRWGFRSAWSAATPRRPAGPGCGSALLLLTAMLVGGALAGLGGMIQFAGVEFQLRPGFAATYGYIGFLASWLARHQPIKVVLAAFAARRRSPSAATPPAQLAPAGRPVNILMALVLLAVLGCGRQAPTKAAA